MYTIENDFLRISVSPKGAELTSLFFKPENTEHLWQADEQWWGWHAPILFPIIGRCIEDQIIVDDEKYALAKHGFARNSDFDCSEVKEDTLRFSLSSNVETLQHYPFEFDFDVVYKLDKNKLHQTFEVRNTGLQKMYFSVGAHPAFAVPFFPNETFEDYTIEFEDKEVLERHHINADGFFNGSKTVVSLDGIIHLHPVLFNNDALIFKNHKSRSLVIKSRNHKQQLKVNFEQFPYLGIWTKEGAPYVCIEPWFGCADTAFFPKKFNEKEGILSLHPSETFIATFNMEISA